MFTYNDTTGEFSAGPISTGTLQFQGVLYRCVSHTSQTPLSTNDAFTLGGRWNPPGSFNVLYTSSSVAVARAFVDWKLKDDYWGIPFRDRPADDLPDLVVLNTATTLADLATDDGLTRHGLPVSYPGALAERRIGYPITQPIGQAIFRDGTAGLVARSARMANREGSICNWADVAIFTDQAPVVTFVDRYTFEEWY